MKGHFWVKGLTSSSTFFRCQDPTQTATTPTVVSPDELPLLNKILNNGSSSDNIKGNPAVTPASLFPPAESKQATSPGATTGTTALGNLLRNSTLVNNVVSALTAGQDQAQEQAQALSNSLATSALGQAVGKIQAAAQASMGYVAVEGCTPKNAEELRYMIDHTTCPRLTLVPATNYSITEQLVIRRRVTLVGRPLGLPIIDAHNTTRAFLVEAGGFLDVRFVEIVKGKFVEVVPLVLYRLRGPTCYIRRGGVALFTGCRFSANWRNAALFLGITPPQTNVQVFGGGIVAESGTLRVTDCHVFRPRIGIAFREIQFIGGEFLVLGGNMYLTGSIFVNMAIFSNSLGAGGYVANLGGTVVITGCLFNYAGTFVCTMGLGYLFFLGGGATILTGCIVTTTIGFAAYFGGGIGIFTGSGVALMTGFIYAANGIMGIGTGLGFQMAVGAGVSIRTGVIQSTMSALGYVTGCGITNYIGAGVTVFSDVILARSTALLTFFGTGSYLYLGAGSATIVNAVGFFNTGIGANSFAGGDMAVFGGYMSRINQVYTSTSAISFAAGQGADLFIGLGGASLVLNLYITPATPVAFRSRGLVAIYVAGNNVFLSTQLGNSTVLFNVLTVNKHGQTDWSRNIFVARKISWRFTDVGPNPDDFVGRRLEASGENKAGFDQAKTSGHGKPAPLATRGEDVEVRPMHPTMPRFLSTGRLGSETSFDVKPTVTDILNKYLPVEDEESIAEDTTGEDGHGRVEGHGNQIDGPEATVAKGVPDTSPNASQGRVEENAVASVTGPKTNYSGDVDLGNITHNAFYAFAEMPGLKVEETKTDKIYVASPMDMCGVCDVTPGNTFDNVDGPGALSACGMQNKCETSDASALALPPGGQGGEKGAGQAGEEQPGSGMWVTSREEKSANSTVQLLEIRTTFTPCAAPPLSSSGASTAVAGVNKIEVAAALREAIVNLGLSERWHLRVEPSWESSKNVDPYLRLEGDAEMEESDATFDYGSIDPAEVANQEACGRKESFKAYLVSDWKNVTDEISRKLKTSTGTKALTLALQKEVEHTAAVAANATDGGNDGGMPASPSVCELVVYRTTSLYVPSTTLAGSGATAVTRLASAPVTRRTTASTSAFHRVLSADGLRFEMEEAEVEEDDEQVKALLSREASAALTLLIPDSTDPYAFLRELPPRVDAVEIDETYSLVLSNFPGTFQMATLTVRAVPEKGEDVLLAILPSQPHMLTRQQVWSWRPRDSLGAKQLVKGREYYLEVTSSDGMAFDATNKFVIR